MPRKKAVPKATPTAPRRGRPPGAKNISYVTLEVTAPRCKCGSTDIKPVRGNATTEKKIVGRTRDGHEYDTIQWQRSKCQTCGQCCVIKTFLLKNNVTSIIRG